MEEMNTAFSHLKNDKAAGPDEFGIEIEKYAASPVYQRKLLTLYNAVVRNGEVPSLWKDVEIAVIHKKGNTEDCNNYRGLSLMSHKGKVLELMIRNRLTPSIYGADQIVPDYQFGFRPRCGTQEAILISHLLAGSAKEYGVPLYKCYIDLTKAYDKVNRDLLWRILTLYGISERYVKVIREMHQGARAKVRWKSYTSVDFPLNRGLKQGSTISPLLWNIFFGALTRAAEKEFAADTKSGVQIWYNMGGKIIDGEGKTLGAIRQCKSTTVWLVCYADDCILFAQSEEQLQRMLNSFHRICMAFGMEISVSKTKVMRMNGAIEDGIIPDRDRREGTATPQPREAELAINGAKLEVAKSFNYLGCVENEDNTMRTEVVRRQYKMLSVFEQLAGRVLQNKRLTVQARLCVFKVVVIPNGIYACTTWNLRAKERDKLEKTYMFLLRKTIGITLKEYETKGHEYFFTLARQKGVTIYSLECYIELYQLRFLWKLQRLGEEKLCGRIAHGRIQTPPQHRRKRGRPAQTFRGVMVEALQHFDVTYEEMTALTWEGWLRRINGTGIELAMERAEYLADLHLKPPLVEISPNEAAELRLMHNLHIGGILPNPSLPHVIIGGDGNFFREDVQTSQISSLNSEEENDSTNSHDDGNALSNETVFSGRQQSARDRKRQRGALAAAERKRKREDKVSSSSLL